MRKNRRDIAKQSLMVPVVALGAVMLSMVCFMLFLWMLIILVRVVLGW